MLDRFPVEDVVDGLAAYLDASPSPFHAVRAAADLLAPAGFTELAETDPWPEEPGRYLTIRGGSLIAWSTEASPAPETPFRVVGAHTDSPNLRVKPQPDGLHAGWQTLGVEVYGGALLNSWLDRDLGLSGRVALATDDGVSTRLFRVDDPLLRVSQLAIHLDRGVNTEGLRLNPQQHLAPHWGLSGTAGDAGKAGISGPAGKAGPAGEPGTPGNSGPAGKAGAPGDFRGWLADTLDVEPDRLLAWDAMTHDLTPARRIGRDADLLASARLDNQATCYAGVRALLDAVEQGGGAAYRPVLVLFDHEEVGSTSERGAQSTFLPAVLERIVLAAGGTRAAYLRSLAGTVIASGDMAHATHPHYAERHEPGHRIRMNGGPVLKVNSNLRYATDSAGAAAFVQACRQAGVPVQTFVTRTDLPCGSTVGPMTSALTGATTVDFGAPVLSMHSAREVCGVADQPMYAAALAAFLNPA